MRVFRGVFMIILREVDQYNFNDCIDLKRESNLFVGSAEYVLANAYIYRYDSTAYAIYDDQTVVGLVIICDRPEQGRAYSFTELFIADDYQRKGLGQAAVEEIMRKLRSEKRSDIAEIQVHYTNEPAIKIYERCGFSEIERAKWNNDFIVMQADI